MKANMRHITSSQIKADLFLKLFRMEASGLSLQQTLNMLKDETSTISPNINCLQSYISKGSTISDSGFKAKLFSTLDRDSIHAGETSGNLAKVYELLAAHYANKARYGKQIKSKLNLPIAMLLLMIFIQPIPDLVLGVITSFEYLKQTVGTILQLLILFYIAMNSGLWLKKLGLETALSHLQLSLPIISNWLITRQINNFFSYLGLLLTSGVPLSQALTTAINTINNDVLKTKFKPIIPSINNGNSLAESLRLVPEIKEITVQQIAVGEQSGRLDQTIQHLSLLQYQAIVAQNKFIAEWIPRIIYGFIVVLIAYSILSTGNISSIQ